MINNSDGAALFHVQGYALCYVMVDAVPVLRCNVSSESAHSVMLNGLVGSLAAHENIVVCCVSTRAAQSSPVHAVRVERVLRDGSTVAVSHAVLRPNEHVQLKLPIKGDVTLSKAISYRLAFGTLSTDAPIVFNALVTSLLVLEEEETAAMSTADALDTAARMLHMPPIDDWTSDPNPFTSSYGQGSTAPLPVLKQPPRVQASRSSPAPSFDSSQQQQQGMTPRAFATVADEQIATLQKALDEEHAEMLRYYNLAKLLYGHMSLQETAKYCLKRLREEPLPAQLRISVAKSLHACGHKFGREQKSSLETEVDWLYQLMSSTINGRDQDHHQHATAGRPSQS